MLEAFLPVAQSPKMEGGDFGELVKALKKVSDTALGAHVALGAHAALGALGTLAAHGAHAALGAHAVVLVNYFLHPSYLLSLPTFLLPFLLGYL